MQVTSLSSERRKYLRVVEVGIDNAIHAIDNKDYEQAYRELEHIHHLPLLILHFKDFDKDFYQIAFLGIYLKHSAPEYKDKIETVLHDYESDNSFIVVDKMLIEELQTVYKNVSIAKKELSHVVFEYPAAASEYLRESLKITHKILHSS